jgi:manganese transport protein
VFLLFVMNRSDLLGDFKNSTLGNVLGVIIVLFAAFLGVRTILFAFGVIG